MMKSPPSEPISKGRENADSRTDLTDCQTVIKELQQIKVKQDRQRRAMQREVRKPIQQQPVQHQPVKKKKSKQKGR